MTNVLFSRDRSDRRSRLDRNTRRVREIVSVAVRYGLAEQFRRLPGKQMQRWLRGSAGQNIADLSTAVRMRLALTELGTTFIKFGQMLSTRADLVGPDVARELTHLQSNTPPDPPGVIDSVSTPVSWTWIAGFADSSPIRISPTWDAHWRHLLRTI